MTTRVFYESWQMQCCGEPFVLGDRVNWTVVPAGPGSGEDYSELFGGEGSGIEWYEEHHAEPDAMLASIHGTVTRIRAIRQRFVTEPLGINVFVPAPGEVVGVDLLAADGWESEDSGPRESEFHFQGYVVTLDTSPDGGSAAP